MSPISSTESDAPQGRRRLTASIKQALRALSIQLSLLNHQVGAHLGLNDVDLDCLDLIARHGPLSPSALAQRASLHPATMTGIDRKSTRLNSSHLVISYAVFCLKQK